MDTGVPQDELSSEAKTWLKSVGAGKYATVSQIVEKKPSDVIEINARRTYSFILLFSTRK